MPKTTELSEPERGLGTLPESTRSAVWAASFPRLASADAGITTELAPTTAGVVIGSGAALVQALGLVRWPFGVA